MNRTQKNYRDSFILGKKAEKDLMALLEKKLNGFISIEEMDYRTHGYDLLLTFRTEEGIQKQRIEVKDLAGKYETGVVEIWADDEKTKRPWWWLKGDTDLIFFRDASRNKWFIYKAPEVIKFLENYKGPTTNAKNLNKHDSGVLAKFYWDPNNLPRFTNKHFIMSGFVASF